MSGCPIETFKLNFYFQRPELNQMLSGNIQELKNIN